MRPTCMYCDKRRNLNPRGACRECQEDQDGLTLSKARTAMMSGTGEEEDEIAEKMWDILDGHPARERKKPQ